MPGIIVPSVVKLQKKSLSTNVLEDSLSDKLFAMLSRKVVLRVLLQDDDGPVVGLHLAVVLVQLKLSEQTLKCKGKYLIIFRITRPMNKNTHIKDISTLMS